MRKPKKVLAPALGFIKIPLVVIKCVLGEVHSVMENQNFKAGLFPFPTMDVQLVPLAITN